MILPTPAIDRLMAGGNAQVCRPLGGKHKTGRCIHVFRAMGHRAACRAEIVAVTDTTLDQLTVEDARAQGYTSLEALHEHWRDRYRTGPLARPRVRVLYVRGLPVEEPVLFLHRDSSRGYTTSRAFAMPGELPVMPDRETLDRFVMESRQRASLERAKKAAKRELEVLRRRLPELRARGSSHVVPLERKLRALEDEAA